MPIFHKVKNIFCGLNNYGYICATISKYTNMENRFFNKNWSYGFDLEQWLKVHKPRKSYNVDFWEDIVTEHKEVVDEFRKLLNSNEQITDTKGNVLTPLNLYNLINEYQVRIDKLALIFNLRLHKTHNENKKTGVKYIVMRVFWIDAKGKNVRWFSRNLGAESKVLVNGNIPINQLDAMGKEMIMLMWDQYQIEYLGAEETGVDEDGNNVIIEY